MTLCTAPWEFRGQALSTLAVPWMSGLGPSLPQSHEAPQGTKLLPPNSGLFVLRSCKALWMSASLTTPSTESVSSPALSIELWQVKLYGGLAFISHISESVSLSPRGEKVEAWPQRLWQAQVSVHSLCLPFLKSVYGNYQREVEILPPSEHGQDQGPNAGHLGETRPGT